jgi:hypothetical protein
MPAEKKSLAEADRYIAAERNVSTGYPIPRQGCYDGEVGDMCIWKTTRLGKFRSPFDWNGLTKPLVFVKNILGLSSGASERAESHPF